MKKLFFIFLAVLVFGTTPSSAQQDKNFRFETMVVTYFFYTYEKSDTAIEKLFREVDSTLSSLKNDPTASVLMGQQITIQAVIGTNINGQELVYNKTYVAGKGPGFIFFKEEYPQGVGALYEYSNRSLLAQSIERFLKTNRKIYKLAIEDQKPPIKKEKIKPTSQTTAGVFI